MKRTLLILAGIVFAIMISRSAFAYDEFTHNSVMSGGTNYYFVYDHAINVSGTFECMDVTNDSSSLTFTNVGCPNAMTLQWLGIRPIQSDEFVKSSSSALQASYSNNQSEAFLVPKNKEVMIVVNYSISNVSEVLNISQGLYWKWLGGSQGDVYLNLSSGWNRAFIILPADASDRYLTVDFLLDFYHMGLGSNVSISKFEIYTLDATESRETASLFTNTTAEAVRYCGAGYSTMPMAGGFCSWSGYYYINHTGFYLVNDTNGQVCGIFAFNGLVVARRLDVAESSLDSLCVYNVNFPPYGGYLVFKAHDPFYFITHLVGGPNEGVLSASELLTSVQLRSMTVTTFVNQSYSYACLSGSGGPFDCGPRTGPHSEDYGNDVYSMPYGTLDYNGVPVNHVDTAFLASVNCTHPPNDYCTFDSPYYFSVVNTTPYSTYPAPAGTAWKYDTTPYYPFFSTAFEVDNVGWSCSVDTNHEFFTTSDGEVVNDNWCGDCGCAGDGFGYRCVQSSAHWTCHSGYEAWHYTDTCDNDIRLICDIRCESGACVGEHLCANSTDCSNYCDGTVLHYSPYCDFSDYNCKWSSTQNCTYGCNSYLNACNENPPPSPVFTNQTTQGIISEISGGILGFLSASGGSIFNLLFFLFVVVVIIALFGLVGYIIKRAFGG